MFPRAYHFKDGSPADLAQVEIGSVRISASTMIKSDASVGKLADRPAAAGRVQDRAAAEPAVDVSYNLAKAAYKL